MEKLTIEELIKKYPKYVSAKEVEYFEKMHSLKNKKMLINKLKRGFGHVETTGRGSKLVFYLDNPIDSAVIDKRSIATTNIAVLKLAQNADKAITKDMVGTRYISKQWLLKMGLTPIYMSKNDFFKKYNEKSDYGNEFEAGVDINDYTKPKIWEVLSSELAQKKIAYVIDRFYGRFFQSVVAHSKLKFEKVYVGNLKIKADTEEKWNINKSVKLNSVQTQIIKKFVEINKERFNSLTELYESKEFNKYIYENLDIISLWTEYELVEAEADTASVITNQAEVTELFADMLVKSIANQEIKPVFDAKKIPYEFMKAFYLSNMDENIKLIYDLEGDITLDKEKDNIWYRLVKDRVLTQSVKKLIEDMQGIKADITTYKVNEKEWKNQFNQLVENNKDLEKMLKKYNNWNKKGIGD
ncbi:hypothetical protein QS460_04390 [Liquorilactobacillus mali]|uniref:hypothetical protein n=1 Tax=Liquorilactobacillus mali TaxID=1618 RepID=UPI00264E9F8E|nr:hypothetical protein [Liquorilactobacillus mali]MDN7145164.1 hypothetical protein [Liquorilactobacillus mali]